MKLQHSPKKQLNSASMPPTLFRKMLVVAILGFSAIWGIDLSSGIIASFDAAAYPICISAFALIYLLSVITKINNQSLHFFAYFIIAGYLISTSIWHHMDANGLFSNAAQWLGLNYVIAYLFLEVKKAAPTTILVFVVTVIGHFSAVIQNHNMADTMGVVLNIAIAHMIYIFLLWTIIKLRVKTDQVIEHADTLENYAYVDLLTRALNRRGIEKVFNELDLDSVEQKKNYAILIIDIDHFKQFNDINGHLVGDEVLTRISGKLSRTIHPNDVLGRWGGEEFIVLTLNRTPQQVMALAENLRAAVSNLVIDTISNITVSIGIGYSHEASSKEAVFKIADEHLYIAKQSGRNTIHANHF
ncbi:GGDEF domain-containing protein [Marinomonas rhizomae]|uniref:diguanylate cyclase n=1 Tax=Marinomonas rhizomae TaxID=491948 RepID=A0A366JDI4_9GAMM|nr:GGDEF domain-containing protein [Marinomonas rhizomae]RBP83918.1 diguanylate cyclase (GGDEF)-like protein [Marinomonas rhizomae]RNF73378.1 GGDEF domain-containing protein [Marinomonas rhizomae]